MATIHQKLLNITALSNRAAISRKAGFGDGYLTAILARRIDISASSAMKLASVLGVSIEWLLDDSQSTVPVRRESAEPAPAAAVEAPAREVAKEKKHRPANAA